MPAKRVLKRRKTLTRRPPKAHPKARSKKKISLRQSLKESIKKKSIQRGRLRSVSRRRPPVRRRVILPVFKIPPLRKHEANPIIEPREGNYWEMKATFNPGAVYADKRVHLLYRAIGGDDVSVLGYASSENGVYVTERLNSPAFVPVIGSRKSEVGSRNVPAPIYSSGGGWNGGCEDPRLILLDDRVYLMYTAFDGWGSIRIALSSIHLNDFLAKRWEWKDSMFISPPGEVHKNWVLFPEKVNGKFAILHSISPEILVEYVDDLDEFQKDEKFIKSHYNRISNTKSWDSWVRGAGPPPIKTKFGWLLFYHAMDTRDPNRYKLGAMILDSNDPTKVLCRTRAPILEPDEWYENTGWKSGVVYSCGAIVKDGELYVYYGGADSVVCVAMANLDKFLDELKKHGVAKLIPQARGEGRVASS
jgi:beta-1,2-mannobiose phosphorylase / 1,2-beta-oligomannan phosphorylase